MGRPQNGIDEAIIGRNLRILRQNRGITARELAARLGVTYQQVQKYEKGISALSCLRLHDASQALGVPYEAFFIDALRTKPGFEAPAIDAAIMARALKLQRMGDAAQRAKILKIIDILSA